MLSEDERQTYGIVKWDVRPPTISDAAYRYGLVACRAREVASLQELELSTDTSVKFLVVMLKNPTKIALLSSFDIEAKVPRTSTKWTQQAKEERAKAFGQSKARPYM